MKNREFYGMLAEDLKRASLTADQVKEALLYNISDEGDKQAVEEVVKEKFASWIPTGMIPTPDSGYDLDADSSYQARGQRMNEDDVEEEEEVDEEEVAASEQKRNELVRLLQETANLADEKGFTRQADFLDDLLLTQL